MEKKATDTESRMIEMKHDFVEIGSNIKEGDVNLIEIKRYCKEQICLYLSMRKNTVMF